MKTLILTLTFTLGFIFAGTVWGQDFNEIYKKYKKQENVTSIKVNKVGCFFASLFTNDDDEGKEFLKKSSSIRILINERDDKNELIYDLQKYIRKNKLEQLMSVQDDEDLVDIYILDKKQSIHELLIIISDKDEQVIVYLDGKYPLKMIKEMMNNGNAKTIKASIN